MTAPTTWKYRTANKQTQYRVYISSPFTIVTRCSFGTRSDPIQQRPPSHREHLLAVKPVTLAALIITVLFVVNVLARLLISRPSSADRTFVTAWTQWLDICRTDRTYNTWERNTTHSRKGTVALALAPDRAHILLLCWIYWKRRSTTGRTRNQLDGPTDQPLLR